MAFSEEDRAVLTQARDDIIAQVNSGVAARLGEYDASLAGKIKAGIETVFQGESPADIASRFDEFQKATQTAVDDMSKRLQESREAHWRDSDGRIRLQGGRYDGIPIEEANVAMRIAQAKASFKSRTSEMDALTQSIESTRIDKDMAERHMHAIRQSLGGRRDPIIQRLEDLALDRPLENNLSGLPTREGVFRTQAITTSTTELTEPILASTLWADLMLMPGVYQRIGAVNMPSPTYKMPSIDDVLVDALDYQGEAGESAGEIVAQRDEDPNFEQTIFTARTIRMAASISEDELEDSVINLAAVVRDTMNRAGQYGLDNFLFNSDESTTAPGATGTAANGNINNAQAATSPRLPVTRLGANGVRKYAIGNAVDAADASPSPELINRCRALLRDAGVMPSDYFYAMPSNTYYAALSNEEFRRYDAAAQLASILRGTMDVILGSPVVISRSLPPQVAGSGRIASTATNNDKGYIILVVPELWRMGVYVPFQLLSAMGQGGTPSAPARSAINPPGINFLLRGRYDVQHRTTGGTYRHTRPASMLRNIDVGDRLA